jgi:hypothetical protein
MEAMFQPGRLKIVSGRRHNMSTRHAILIFNRQLLQARFRFGIRLAGGSATEGSMEEYRAFVFGPDGHIVRGLEFRCSGEKEAQRLAKSAVDGHAVELWQTDRFIERFEPEEPHKTSSVDP